MNHDEPAASGANESPTPATESLEAVCDAFEQAWVNERTPRIEDYAARVTLDDRADILRELLQIELWWRSRLGETPEIADYLQRFPNESSLVEQAFAAYQTASTGGATTDPHTSTHVAGRSDVATRSRRERKDGSGAKTLGTSTSSGMRFRVLRPHAKGGLGEVFVARDEELQREVALKQIQIKSADDPQNRARFVQEAEITGGLEHPGVVPVYGLGQDAQGRPYYAMRFIRGDSLRDAIKRFHEALPALSVTDSSERLDHVEYEEHAGWRRLVGLERFAEAERWLVEGYEGLKSREETIPPLAKTFRIAESLERLVELYTLWDRPTEAARWKRELEAVRAPTQKR